MKRLLSVLVVLQAAALAWAAEIVSPRDGETVPLVHETFKAFLLKDRAERRELIASEKAREEMKKTYPEYAPLGVRFAWTGKKGGTLTVRRKADGRLFFEAAIPSNNYTLVNFEIACDYEWQVRIPGEKTLTGHFATEDFAPRMISWPDIPNMRDLGGRKGLGGRRIRQGLVFRSAGLNNNARWEMLTAEELARAESEGRLEETLAKSVDGDGKPTDVQKAAKRVRRQMKKPEGLTADFCSYRFLKPGTWQAGASRLTEASRERGQRQFGIRTELDLRTYREVVGMEGSPLGPSVRWVNVSAANYDGMEKRDGREAFAKCFRLFLDEANYPIVFHCIAGADRTGSLACILEGLLGVEEEELYRDWEITWPKKMNGTAKRQNHARLFDKLIAVFDKQPGATLNDRIAAYVRSCGFTDEDINKFRKHMLED